MKSLLKSGGLLIISMLVLSSCKNEKPQDESIEGIYYGTLIKSGDIASGGSPEDAVAQIAITGENEIRVSCNTSSFDTLFMLNYYSHHDSVYVCFTGEEFEEMYGHMPGEGHSMGGGMMGDIGNDETEWMHHINDEHDADDVHFGGFDMDHHAFTYTFEMMDGENPYTLRFKGTKQ